jgi:hypothetical protein
MMKTSLVHWEKILNQLFMAACHSVEFNATLWFHAAGAKLCVPG